MVKNKKIIKTPEEPRTFKNGFEAFTWLIDNPMREIEYNIEGIGAGALYILRYNPNIEEFEYKVGEFDWEIDYFESLSKWKNIKIHNPEEELTEEQHIEIAKKRMADVERDPESHIGQDLDEYLRKEQTKIVIETLKKIKTKRKETEDKQTVELEEPIPINPFKGYLSCELLKNRAHLIQMYKAIKELYKLIKDLP